MQTLTFPRIGTVLAFVLLFVTARADTVFVVNIATKTIEQFASDGTPTLFAHVDSSTYPSGIAVDGAGNVFVSNPSFGGSFITRFPPTGGTGTVFADSGLSDPAGLAFDREGNLYAANVWNNTITRTTTNGVTSVFASDPGDRSVLDQPQGLAFDTNGNLFVSCDGSINDDNSNDNNFIEKFSTNGTPARFVTDPGDNSILWEPEGIAFDKNNNLFVANDANGIIEKFAPDGAATDFYDGGAGAQGLAFDSAGNLYSIIMDANALGTILKFPAGTNIPVIFAADPGDGSVMYSPQYMAILPDATAPWLSIFLNGTDAVVSWPLAVTGFTLETSTNLGTTNWVTITDAPGTFAGKFVITNSPVGSGSKFFRLKK
jgi:DNA-binding beta-propeller fold protein YncE